MSETVEVDPRIERTRRVVLDAAAQVVAENGIGRASIEAISERSGVARSTIYRHWPDRNVLFMECLGSKIKTDGEIDNGNLREDLIQFFGQLATLLEDRDTRRMVASHIAESTRDPELAQLHARFTERRRELTAEIVNRGVKRGELPKSADAARMADDMAAGIFFRALIRQEPIDAKWLEGHIDRWIGIHSLS